MNTMIALFNTQSKVVTQYVYFTMTHTTSV